MSSFSMETLKLISICLDPKIYIAMTEPITLSLTHAHRVIITTVATLQPRPQALPHFFVHANFIRERRGRRG